MRRALVLAVTVLSACQAAPMDVREWKPSDHGHTSTSGAAKKGQSTGEAKARAGGIDEVTISTWQAKCVVCHGRVGRGDGPQAVIFKPRDLTDATWQAAVTDAQLLRSIQKGLNKMPAFDLPESTATKMVALVRQLVQRGAPAGASAKANAAASATPAPTAAVAAVPVPTTAATATATANAATSKPAEPKPTKGGGKGPLSPAKAPAK